MGFSENHLLVNYDKMYMEFYYQCTQQWFFLLTPNFIDGYHAYGEGVVASFFKSSIKYLYRIQAKWLAPNSLLRIYLPIQEQNLTYSVHNRHCINLMEAMHLANVLQSIHTGNCLRCLHGTRNSWFGYFPKVLQQENNWDNWD